MGNSASNLFAVTVAAASAQPAIGNPGDAIPPGPGKPALTQLVDFSGAAWTFNASTRQIFRNGIDTKQPFADTERVYLNTGSVAWLRSPSHGYNYWNGTVWGFTGHGPDGNYF